MFIEIVEGLLTLSKVICVDVIVEVKGTFIPTKACCVVFVENGSEVSYKPEIKVYEMF
jgi:hypothetical protein